MKRVPLFFVLFVLCLSVTAGAHADTLELEADASHQNEDTTTAPDVRTLEADATETSDGAAVMQVETEPSDEISDVSESVVDYTDQEQRNREITDICEAACAGATQENLCIQNCQSQTHACFNECDTLPARKNDCFVGCTHIAVDERDRQEQELEAHVQAMDENPVYGRKFAFGMNAVAGLHHVPNFLVGTFFQLHQSHWADKPKYFYGGEFVFRFEDRHDLLLTIDYADYRTRDGWWLENDKNATAAEWVHNDMRALAITVGWNGIANLDKRKRAHFYGGIGLGMLVKFGDFNKAKVRLGCVNPSTDISVYDDLTPSGACPEDNGTVLIDQDPATGEITEWTQEKIPSILPSLIATAGFRYIIADTVSIAVEGGWKTVAFYGALKVGFMVGKSNAKRQRELTQEALRPD